MKSIPIKFPSWVFIVGLGFLSGLPITVPASEVLPLAGEWRFALDREDVGVQETWFNRDLSERIQLPGILQAQGYGEEISIDTPWVLSLYDRFWYLRQDYQAYTNAGHVKVPFVCQPPRHYVGVAWYQRDIEIPAEWQNRRVELFLERTRWESTIWLDDTRIGSNNSLCAPHDYDLGVLPPGKHRLSVRLDTRMLMNYRPDAHAVSDSLGSTWNGIVGKIELRAEDVVRIEQLELRPDLARKGVEAWLHVRNDTGQPIDAPMVMLQVAAKNFGGNALKPVQTSATIKAGADLLKVFFPMTDSFEEWSEFNPKYYSLRATIGGSGFHSEKAGVFGMRDFKTQGREFVINGHLTNLRGTHHGGDFPLTGYPPCDVEYWLKVFGTCKAWGLNHVRFHSFCPPEAAFTAADQVGIYLQVEPGMWNEISPGTPMEEMLYAETDRILKAYGNHPSFVLMSASNEAKARWKEALPKWVQHFREVDPRHLYTPDTGWSLIDDPEPVADRVDYLAVHRVGPRLMRGDSGWFGRDYSKSYEGVDVPNIVHENGQWCAYPDFNVIPKFSGFIEPGNYEIFRDSLANHGMAGRDKDFAWASGRFQLACYKEEIEANLRTPGLGGFQLLDLHDYTGQGTALVGLLDPFWLEKGYVNANEWGQFCSATVPLARLQERVFTTDDMLEVPVEVAHYGIEPIENAVGSWQIENASGEVAVQGKWPARTIPLGKATELGTIWGDLAPLEAPGAYRLVVRIEQPSSNNTGDVFENSWNFWLYPAATDASVADDVLVTTSWDDAEARLAAGGKVLFQPRTADLGWSSPPLDRLPIFWNRLMNPQWSRMLGLWCDTNHPALTGFPTDANCDWQWTSIIRGVRAMNMEKLPGELQPIVQAVDDWNRNWKLGVVYECKVGQGRMVVCTVDLEGNLSRRPVAAQLRRSLLSYMSSPAFQPEVEITATQLREVLFNTRIMRDLGAVVEADGANPEALIDGDPNTYWLVGPRGRREAPIPHPHTVTISFPQPVAMNGLVFMTRQNDRNHQGDIRAFRLEMSDDGQDWQMISEGELASTWDPQSLTFDDVLTARQLRLTALSGFGDDPTAALADLAVKYAGPGLGGSADGAMEYQRVRSTSTDVDEGD